MVLQFLIFFCREKEEEQEI